ncbi:hypothetical protein IP88_14880 [alpha proteobacterium AAP81b]|nr:hypothetical protein IP88_14880 [alpha proteobacterium AAP81b]
MGGTAEQIDSADAARIAAAHRQLVADGATQFDLPTMVPPTPPTWLKPLFDWLATLGPYLRYLFYGVLIVVALLILRGLWLWLAPIVARWRGRAPATPEEWRPDVAPARALLAEAEALAAAGAYGEAAHLLLLRSVEQIEARYPGTLTPADTSRDIARAPMLSPPVAQGFGRIAAIVEAGLFAGRALGEDAWRDCRDAYAAAAFGGNNGAAFGGQRA